MNVEDIGRGLRVAAGVALPLNGRAGALSAQGPLRGPATMTVVAWTPPVAEVLSATRSRLSALNEAGRSGANIVAGRWGRGSADARQVTPAATDGPDKEFDVKSSARVATLTLALVAGLGAARAQQGTPRAQVEPPRPAARVQAGPSAEDLGRVQYEASCASCHGMRGIGDGPVRAYLTKAPSDLTTLSRRYGGVFPNQMVWEVIDGRTSTDIGPHGSREMPVWGIEYRRQALQYPGVVAQPEWAVRGRIVALLDYLASIQSK